TFGQIIVKDASTVIENVSTGVVIDASVSYTAPTGAGTLNLIGTSNIAATGNSGSIVLTGGAGNDTLIAESTTTTLIGGTGNTTFIVQSGDHVQNTVTTANDTLESSVSFTLPTNVNTLLLTGTDALVGTANGANDTLISNS